MRPADVVEAEAPKRRLNAGALHELVGKLLKSSSLRTKVRYWLRTQWVYLHSVLGSGEYGLPYGKVYELAGVEHGGKTVIGLILAGLAQKDGAVFGYMDLENSRDKTWSMKLGVDWGNTFPIWPKLVRPRKKKLKPGEKKKVDSEDDVVKGAVSSLKNLPVLQSSEELFTEMETAMALLAQQGWEKQYWFIDSIAMIRTAKQIDAGNSEQNMNTKLDRAAFLSDMLPKLTALAANYNAMIVFSNQVRNKVGMVFGDPLDSPGGRALRHCLHVRARIRRVSNGKLRQGGKTIGIVGIISNIKNKAGRGSVEQEECGFSVRWDSTPAKVSFVSRKAAEDLIKGERSKEE